MLISTFEIQKMKGFVDKMFVLIHTYIHTYILVLLKKYKIECFVNNFIGAYTCGLLISGGPFDSVRKFYQKEVNYE